MKSKIKLFVIIGCFLVLIPFRLPMSVLLIKLFDSIAQLEGTQITHSILHANVIVTKIIYNLFFGTILVYNVEHLSRELKGRKAKEEALFWWTAITIFLLVCYLIFDSYWVSELYNVISN